MDQQKIGLFLKQLRKEKNLTQGQLAEILNVSDRTVSRWETGNNMPDLSILVDLADFYNVDVREIIDGERKERAAEQESRETIVKLSDYSKEKEAFLLKKITLIILVGFVAWAVSFSFMLRFMEAATGAELVLLCETALLLLYCAVLFCIKTNRSAGGYLNTIIGAQTAIVVANAVLCLIFFSSGSYYNYGLIGAYYSFLAIFIPFLITAIIIVLINKKTKR
ncbi:MAG: helix-turn-helix transcriptional regulator [Clostridia bacterium]|nr:helix-turn-helix transcriptional regulator [Clostridia bacterium]